MESEEEEKINQQKIESQNILSEEEIINSLDMKIYRDRIENLIGKQYSYLFFVYFENIYHSKIKNKMSLPLTEYLNKENNTNVTFWMQVYKSIKFYSKENLPIIINKYFNLKAEAEFKYIYNESKKYTSAPHKFIDVYIKKMKKANQKKLFELKSKNQNINVFDLHKKQSIFVRAFLSKKTIIRPKLSFLRNQLVMNNPEDEPSELSNKEEEIKRKKERRLQIIKQIHQMKINSIKEVEKANILQNKQKKKYGGIKSRFLDAYNEQGKFFNIINSKSIKKFNHNYLHNNKLSDIEGPTPSSKILRSNSKNSSKTLLYLNTRENYTSRKNLHLNPFSPEEKKFLNHTSHKGYCLKKNLYKNGNKYYNQTKRYTPKNLKALNLFNIDNNIQDKKKNNYKILLTMNNANNERKIKINKYKLKEYLENKNVNSTTNYKNNKKVGINLKKIETNYLIDKLSRKKSREILENLKEQKNDNEGYNNIIYNIFKRTEIL